MNLKSVVAFVEPQLANDLKHQAIDEGVTVMALAKLGLRMVRDGIASRDKKILAAVRELAGDRVQPGPKRANQTTARPS